MPSIEVLIIAPVVILVAYIIFGMTGFGSTLIAVPLLAHLLPLHFVIPMVVILDCAGALSLGVKLRADAWKAEFMPMLPFLLAGLFIGVYVLLKVPPQWLLAILGVFVLIFGGNFMMARKTLVWLPKWSVAPIGLFAGTTSSAFGVGGPIYVFYFTGRGATPEQIRATIPVVFCFTTVARIVIFAGAGLFNPQILIGAGLLLPVMAFGLWCGHRLHLNLSREHVVRVMGALLLLSGASLLVRAAAM